VSAGDWFKQQHELARARRVIRKRAEYREAQRQEFDGLSEFLTPEQLRNEGAASRILLDLGFVFFYNKSVGHGLFFWIDRRAAR